MGNWLENVKVSNTIDMSKPVDTRFEMAMLNAYGKGHTDGYKQAEADIEANIIDVGEVRVLKDDEYAASETGGEAL